MMSIAHSEQFVTIVDYVLTRVEEIITAAADKLKKMGYREIKSLKGDSHAWNEAGLPIEKNEA